MNDKPDNTVSHVFASTCYGWAVGQSVEEVIKRLATDVSAEGYKRGLDRHAGLIVWTHTVPLPQSAEYEIHGYIPSTTKDGKEIKLADSQRHIILSPKGAFITIPR
jgi:hypothetical protein